MAALHVRDLDGDFDFGARVDGVTWENIYDQDVRSELVQLFEGFE